MQMYSFAYIISPQPDAKQKGLSEASTTPETTTADMNAVFPHVIQHLLTLKQPFAHSFSTQQRRVLSLKCALVWGWNQKQICVVPCAVSYGFCKRKRVFEIHHWEKSGIMGKRTNRIGSKGWSVALKSHCVSLYSLLSWWCGFKKSIITQEDELT